MKKPAYPTSSPTLQFDSSATLCANETAPTRLQLLKNKSEIVTLVG